ncbi:MAG: hypothetical protein M1822_004586 [Bathelium mastoideum]|nr:MAG: hypothetical protein M1822_004586 [Bathelium mastoideum]
MDAALGQIKNFAAEADEPARRRIITLLQKLANSLETVDDTLLRYSFFTMQTACVKIGFDLGLFKYLTESHGPVAVDVLSRKTGTEGELMNRILRFLAVTGAVDEVSKEKYAANHVTRNLSEKVAEADQNLPAFLKKTGYQNPADDMHTSMQDAYNTTLPAFAWLAEHPENLAYFNDYMALRRQPETSWLSVYPVEQETQGHDPEKPVYVNIGGGIGHQCAQFVQKYPKVPGRVILQDLPMTIEQALQTRNVENMAHDFWKPQPIHVLHDHPPHKVRQLLENTKAAMTRDSVLLIDEMVLPETGVDYKAAASDLAMMAGLAGMERTERQWRQTFEEVGLELVRIYTYNALSNESVMDVRLPQ